jgi:hypothetical protein
VAGLGVGIGCGALDEPPPKLNRLVHLLRAAGSTGHEDCALAGTFSSLDIAAVGCGGMRLVECGFGLEGPCALAGLGEGEAMRGRRGGAGDKKGDLCSITSTVISIDEELGEFVHSLRYPTIAGP